MIRSMTGFGHSTAGGDDITISAEISSLNHRYLDIGMKLPSLLSSFENEARKLLQSRLERGRINVLIVSDGDMPESGRIEFDQALARQYIDTARAFALKASLRDDIGASSTLRLGSLWTLKTPPPEEMGDLWELTEKALNGAVDQLIEMREIEGANIWSDLSARGEQIDELVREIAGRIPQVVEEYRERLRERIASVLSEGSEIDEQKLLTEAAVFADRADISEELARLDSHTKQFEALAKQESNVGRRLDFLLQEMFRETSTVGSKARDAGISHAVVEVKGQLEKMREQVQNVE